VDKILVVDDEPDTVNLAKMILETERYQVLVASDGVEALQKAKVELPDLILLDVILPAKTGLEVCKILKSQDRTKHIPVIMFTVLSKIIGDDVSKKHADESGCDGYLAKPFTCEGLLTEVKKQLDQVKARRICVPAKHFDKLLTVRRALSLST
jgi:DNA-binding response OmpR family regulator